MIVIAACIVGLCIVLASWIISTSLDDVAKAIEHRDEI